MEVDTNELLHRIGAVLRVMSDKMDRLIEAANDHFAGANKMVAEEPAKEAEHPAGPMPDPGEGYRLLSKNPPEELHVGDEHELSKGNWVESANARTHKRQARLIWYRRKIEPAKDEYREPVLPGDVMQQCEFSMTGKDWYEGLLAGFQVHNTHPWSSSNLGRWKYARIRVDA